MKRLLPINADNPFTGRHMLVVMCAFFGVVILVNIVMAAVALRSFPGVIVANSYLASQSYNAMVREGRAQEERGWHGEVTVVDGRLAVTLGAGGAGLGGAVVSARVGRPASGREDRILAFERDGGGYRSVAALAPGRWLVELRVHDGDGLLYRRTGDVLVRAPEAARAP